MKTILLVAAALCALEITAPASAAVTPQGGVKLDCGSAPAIYEAWRPALDAYDKDDTATAKTLLDAMIAACPTSPLLDSPRIMRADIAVSEGDNAGALKTLANVERPRPPGSLGTRPNFIALKAAARLKDVEAYARERRLLAEGVERQLVDPAGPVKAKLVERFTVGSQRVSAFEGEYKNGPFFRQVTFVIEDDAPFAQLRTIMLGTDPIASFVASGPPAYFLDAYDCEVHATLEVIRGPKPSYAALKDKVQRHLAGRGPDSMSSTELGDKALCGFSGFVAPGFEPPERPERE